VLRRIIPAGVGGGLFAVLAVLWLVGAHQPYMAFFRLLGVEPFRFPFLDAHAVLAAIECHRLGIDVYAWNPCDALGRFHVYSPLWLHLSILPVTTAWTNPVGLVLDVCFLAGLVALPPAQRPITTVVMSAAVVSPAVIFALERANNDLLMFLLAMLAGCLALRSGWPRLLGYAAIVVAAALKFYPVTLLILAWREPWPRCLMILALSLTALLVCLLPETASLLRVLPLVPTGDIGAVTLPQGLIAKMDWPAWAGWVIYAVLLFVAAPMAFRLSYAMQSGLAGIPEAERVFLTVGAALMVGCFFAGQSIGYRAIHLLFVLPALQLAAEANPRIGRLAVASVLWAMWGDALRTDPGGVADALWLVDQCVWWIVITILSGCLLALLRLSLAWTSLWGQMGIGVRPTAKP
jgi:hypothetical protein